MLLLDVHGPELIGERLLQSLGTARSMGLRINTLTGPFKTLGQYGEQKTWLVGDIPIIRSTWHLDPYDHREEVGGM